jgi:ABC-type nitrate/sulfonate/bicarbonate transport system substrate-binding protein
MKRSIRTRTLFLALTLIATAAIPSVYAQTPPPILVAYAGQNETVGPMWVGIEKGMFRKYGLDVRLVQLRNGALSMATLSSGQVEYNYGSPGNALSAAVGGMKIQCVASPVQKFRVSWWRARRSELLKICAARPPSACKALAADFGCKR